MNFDNYIIEGFRRGDARVFKNFFYEYCEVAYRIFDQRYGLSQKENLDFMSLAHQYALYLMEHDWKPLEDRSPNVSLRTWMINGFRYIVLDALKWYKREYGTLTFEDYIKSFDTSQNLRLNFNKLILDICDAAKLDRISRTILVMLLVEGYKSKDIAAKIGITPSAVSQRFQTLKDKYIIPYFKENFDMDFDMAEVMDVEVAENQSIILHDVFPTTTSDYTESISSDYYEDIDGDSYIDRDTIKEQYKEKSMEKKRTTPEFINHLEPGEIFVFGSNLRGMHGGGAAYAAYRKFGAIMGQGVGLQGQSYAIPTMQGGVETIKPYVDEFIAFAKEHPQLTFLVTRIGCGIAGFTDDEISPLFDKAHDVENIVLPEGW